MEVFEKYYIAPVTCPSVLEHVSRPIYIHFLDRELLTALGAYATLSESVVYEDLRLMLLSTYEPAYLSVSLVFENRFARNIFWQLLPLFQRGHIQIAMKESSLHDFILSKKEQYLHAKKLYPFYFNDTWKHIAKHAPVYRHKELDTTTIIKDTLISDLRAYGALNSAKRLGISVDQQEVIKLTPYTVEALELRGKRAITKLLFVDPYEKLGVSLATKRSFDIKISEKYVFAYISEYDGTIATGLRCGVEYFHYLSPTFPFHHIPLWYRMNQRLGYLATIRSLSAEDIATLRETGEFQEFVDEFRFFIARAIQNRYLIHPLAVPHHPTITEYLERAISANLHAYPGNIQGINHYLHALKYTTNIMRTLDIISIDKTQPKLYAFQNKLESTKTLFYSYAHEDEQLFEQLEKHLHSLLRQGLISGWHNRQIVAGTNWAKQVNEHLETASIILLLVSPDFLASDYCYNIQMQRALERQKLGEACVVPIILRPVDWYHAPFAHLQVLPHNGKAVTEWNNQDAAFRDIAQGIRHIIMHPGT